MQVTALKTFAGKMGLVRTGMTITVDERYGKQLIKSKLAVLAGAQTNNPDDPTLQPERNTDLGGPESTKDDEDDEGNEEEGDDPEDESSDEPDEESSETTDEQGSSQERGSGSGRSSSADRRGGGRARPLSSQQVGRRSRKKT
jgi:hypothetical protein